VQLFFDYIESELLRNNATLPCTDSSVYDGHLSPRESSSTASSPSVHGPLQPISSNILSWPAYSDIETRAAMKPTAVMSHDPIVNPVLKSLSIAKP
jgi:hypothetical protein